VCLSELRVWVPVLNGLQIILCFVYYLVYLKFLLLCCIGLQGKDNYCTICSVDNTRIRNMPAQLLLKTEKTLATATFSFCVYIYVVQIKIFWFHTKAGMGCLIINISRQSKSQFQCYNKKYACSLTLSHSTYCSWQPQSAIRNTDDWKSIFY